MIKTAPRSVHNPPKSRKSAYKGMISLGTSCATKYQIGRYLFKDIWPDASDFDYRNAIHGSDTRSSFIDTNIFDWKITPPDALLYQLETDFENSFNREDLKIMPDGHVYNVRLGTALPHDFHAGTNGTITGDDLDNQYCRARIKHDYLAKKFLDRLQDDGPYLYILRDFPDSSTVDRIVAAIGRYPNHDFNVLLISSKSFIDYNDLTDRLITAKIPEHVNKPDNYLWEGDDDIWHNILDQHNRSRAVDLPNYVTQSDRALHAHVS